MNFKNLWFSISLDSDAKLYSLTKTELEKCSISDILNKKTKIFQIRRFCASLRNNKRQLFWCQKLPKINLGMTLGLIFNHLFWTHHFGAFSVLHTKYSSIFGDKKIQTQKWCIAEKFQPQKFGVTKGYFILKVVSDCDFDHFLEKMSPVPPGCSTFRSGLTW